MRHERRPRLRRERPRGQPVVLARPPEEVLGQPDDVLAPLPERRQRERQDREAMIEVLPEAPRPRRRQEILAGRGHDPHVHRLAPRAPQPPDRALLQHLQQLGLQRLRQESHLVQEQHPPVRRLQEPGLGVPGVRERPALEPEELRLEQGLGNGRAVHVHERPGGPRPRAVEDPRQEPLPRARLTQEQDRGRPPRSPALPAEQPAHLLADGRDRGALAQELGQRGRGGHRTGDVAHPSAMLAGLPARGTLSPARGVS
jgi:hypothetical protein